MGVAVLIVPMFIVLRVLLGCFARMPVFIVRVLLTFFMMVMPSVLIMRFVSVIVSGMVMSSAVVNSYCCRLASLHATGCQ
jgi:hypothetical protein